ncbi:MAG: glycosyl transferase, partial [Bilophila sp.]
MNIAFVNATVRWGGVKTWYLEFAERLAQRGNLVRVYGRQETFVQAAQERVGHGETARFGADLNPATVYRF